MTRVGKRQDQDDQRRPYARVSLEIYGDRKFCQLSPVKPSGQSLWLYLLTGHFRTKVPGICTSVGLGGIADRLGWPTASVKRHWNEIERLEMAAADWTHGMIWMPRGLEHNPPQNPNIVRGWAKVPLPQCPLMTRALRALRAGLAAKYEEPFVEAFDESFGESFPESITEPFVESFTKTGSGSGCTSTPPYPPAAAGGRITRVERRLAADELRQFRDREQAAYRERGGAVPWHQREREGLGHPEPPKTCPHEPPCVDDGDCLVRIVVTRRQREADLLTEQAARR